MVPASGTATQVKKGPEVGALQGALLIQWVRENFFIYVPDPKDPLRFTARDGREIKPGRMYTDGGSIPRVFWGFKGFSPWGYASAYVLHDWLFHQHRCGRDVAPNNFTFEAANQVLDDVIEILFKSNTAEPNERARALIKWAVDNYAQAAWNEPCDIEPPEPKFLAQKFGLIAGGPVTIARISFSE